MLCGKCSKGKNILDKKFYPSYCGGCGFAFLSGPDGNPTDVTCLQSETYQKAVERGLIKGGPELPKIEPEAPKVVEKIPETIKAPSVPAKAPIKVEPVIVKAPAAPLIKEAPKVGSLAERMYEVIKKFGPIGKSDILSKSGVAESDYLENIKILLNGKRILQEGAKRGTKYKVI